MVNRVTNRLAALAVLGGMVAWVACSDGGSEPQVAADAVDAVALDAAADASDASESDATEPIGACTPTPERCDALDASAEPPRLSEFALAYHEGTTTMYVVGGSTAVPAACERPPAQYVAEMWAFDDVCGTWRNLASRGPSPRGRALVAADADAVWLFGGRWRASGSSSGDYTMYDDLWRFDVSTELWTEIDVPAGPRGRADGAMTYDAATHQLILFGGNASPDGTFFEALDDTWIFDIATETWREVATPARPSPRLYHAQTFDASRGTMVIYGGGDNDAFNPAIPYMGDLWSFAVDTESWTLLASSVGAPEGRFWGELVHDTAFDSYVMFGGHDATDLGNRNDLWEFRLGENAWAPLAIGDTFNRPAPAPCEFPPDFTIVDTALPERRSAHGMVWSQTCNHAIVFGGKTDCGAINDVWRLVDGAFVEAREAGDGEVCHRFRSNPDNCVNLCF